ncbi:hypothetical protein C1646_773911 [Rhizophagus diaphanus]|nr:hypothetical protein C1646_773911 [Rhizophagus diaphanus] [Rhizophagus sp. MUCL 43196]
MDIYDDLVKIWDKHYKQKHENKSLKYEKDWSCPRCYSGKIVTNFEGYLEEGYDDEATEVKRMKAIDVMIRSIRYSERPTKTYKGISTVIEMIMEKCVRKSDEGIIVGNEEVLKQELENDREIKRFGHRIGEKEIERRFQKELDDDKFEIISSDESEMASDDEKKEDVSRVMKMGFIEYMSEIKFWEEYQKIQENSNEYVKEKLEELMIKIEDERNEIKRKLKELELWKSRKEKKPEVDKEIKELNTLYENITDLGYKIEKVDIKRLLNLGFDQYELFLDGIIEKYLENKDKNDKEIQRILMQLMKTKGYGRVSDREFDGSDESNETDESNKSDESEESEYIKIFEEIIRTDLKKLGYDVKITEIEKLRKFGVPWRNENTKECEKCEVEKLKKEFRIGKEICVECEKNIGKENLSSDEEEEEKSIKGPEIGSITMGAMRNEMRNNLATFANILYGQDIGLNWAAPIPPPITLTGLQGEIQNNTNAIGNLNANRGAIVEILMFYRTKGENPEKWLEQLERINQVNEDVSQYFTRFKYFVKRAEGDIAVAANQQKRIFIRGLRSEFIKDVTMSNPADLNAAFQTAKNVKRGLEALTNKVQPKEISNDTQKRQEPIVQASVRTKEIDDLTSIPVCYKCKRTGHFANNCFEGRNAQTNYRVNMMDGYYNYDDEHYDYNEYSYEELNYNQIYHMEDYYYDNNYCDNDYELYGKAEPTTKKKRQLQSQLKN